MHSLSSIPLGASKIQLKRNLEEERMERKKELEEKIKGLKEEKLNISVIPCNAEKYMAFYIDNSLSFIDSFQFMSSSLCKLAGNLSEERQFQLMKEKGVYPYDYMDSFSKFNDTQLPSKKDF